MKQTKLSVVSLEKKLLKTWVKCQFLLLLLGGAFIASPTSHAEISICASEDAFCDTESIPFQNFETTEIPNYTVRIKPSNTNLPDQLYDLSPRAVRVLPHEISKLAHKEHVENIPQHGIISITTDDKKPFCNQKKQFCWFKSMLLSGSHVHITDWEDKTLIYRDTVGLNHLFWSESASID